MGKISKVGLGNEAGLGRKGVEIVKEILRNSNKVERFCQIDWMYYDREDNWYSIEVKYQEYFRHPPFDGHGLPPYQVETRLRLEKQKGITALFVVCDPTSGNIYMGKLRDLESGRKYITKSKDPRVIYPLENFEIIGKFDKDTR